MLSSQSVMPVITVFSPTLLSYSLYTNMYQFAYALAKYVGLLPGKIHLKPAECLIYTVIAA